MPVNSDGTFTPLTTEDIINDMVDQLRTQFGNTVDISPGSTLRKLLESSVALGLAEAQQDMDDLYAQMFPADATGINLDKHFEFYPGIPRRQSTRAVGSVDISLNALQTSPDPLFSAGSLVFVATGGRKFDLASDVALPVDAFSGGQTGTASESIDATNTRIAQQFSLNSRTFVQGFQAYVNVVSGAPTFSIRIETDNAGSPSGTLADSRLSYLDWTPAGGSLEGDVFAEGAYLDENTTYWLVFERSAGTATFDGGAGGTANRVSYYAGSWNLSATVENLNVNVVEGAVASVKAQAAGSGGNVPALDVGSVQFNDATSSSRWASIVQSFTNNGGFQGGQDREEDIDYAARVRDSYAARPESTPDAIAFAVSLVDGVDDAEAFENTGDTVDGRNTVLDVTSTGTASESIDTTTNTRIAQKFTTTDRRFVQQVVLKLNTDASLAGTIRIETDGAGAPSGTLAFASLTGDVTFGGTADVTVTFQSGAYLAASTTYWVVFEATSGSGTFDGEGASGDGNVSIYSGGWSASANVDNVRSEVVGGIPPHAFRIVVDGGLDDDVATSIWQSKPAGIPADGKDSGIALARSGASKTVHFERPTPVEVYMNVEVLHTASFTGSANDVRNIIVTYVGGTYTDGSTTAGLGIGETLYRDEVISRLLDDDNILETLSVPTLQLDTVDPPTGTTDLVPGSTERFTISDPSTQVSVTLTQVS